MNANGLYLLLVLVLLLVFVVTGDRSGYLVLLGGENGYDGVASDWQIAISHWYGNKQYRIYPI